LFRAVGFAPLDALRIPERYWSLAAFHDVTLLIKTPPRPSLRRFRRTPPHTVLSVLDQRARSVTITLARDARRIADVPSGGKLHVFNHFFV
jgi:hypothetical protein